MPPKSELYVRFLENLELRVCHPLTYVLKSIQTAAAAIHNFEESRDSLPFVCRVFPRCDTTMKDCARKKLVHGNARGFLARISTNTKAVDW